MKKQKRFRNVKRPQFIGDIREFVLQRLVNMLVIAAFIIIIFILIKAFLYKSDYFRLRSIETKDCFLDQRADAFLKSQLFGAYRGRNVFRIDLPGTASAIQSYYPDAKDVVVRLAMPDKLAVSMRFRKPVAVVSGGRSYPIDEEGYVLAASDRVSMGELPVIEGVNIRYDEKRGKKNTSRNLRLALELLKEIKKSRAISAYKVDVIRAGDIRNLSFVFRNGPEIRIGYEYFRERLSTLEYTLRDPRLLLDRIEYIDLRFKDVVIGPK